MKWAVDTVVFDFDGVVVNTGGDIANAANYILRHYDLPELPTETIVGFIGGGAEPLVRKCLGDKADMYFEEALSKFKKRYIEHYFEDTVLYPGVKDVLEHLYAARKKMGIATNKIEKIAFDIQEGLEIAHYFQVVVGPESVTRRKPDPEAVNIVLERLGADPARSLMIGDKAEDILAGKAAGTVTCGVTYGFGSVEEIEGSEPDFIISQAADLLNYIE
ncbi:MAG: HAD-IA family hydrolase [Anaerolineae bacterium]|nr:HAD-IA family hydrolase [Anaerolineae bacterium]